MKQGYESKFIRNDKKKWIDKFTGKEVNFKKYIELKFFIKGEEVDKTKTMYEIISRYKSNQPTYMVIGYKFIKTILVFVRKMLNKK